MRVAAGALAALLALAATAPADDRDPLAAFFGAVSEAETALREGERELAESRFRTALAEGWLLLASNALVEDRPADAAVALERARQSVADTLRPDIATSLLHVRRGEAALALPILRRHVAEQPELPALRRLLAQALIADGQVAEALEELSEAWRRFPDDAETAFALAGGALRLGDLERAEAAFAALAELEPRAATWVLIGRSYRDHRHPDRARRALETAVGLDPTIRRAHYYLGMVALQAQGYEGLETAVEHFRRELATRPDDRATHLNLGIALVELRRCGEATASLELATTSPSTAVDAHRFLGKCHLQHERPGDAVIALRHALELAGGGVRPRQLESIHYQLGVALRRLGDPAAEHHFALAEELAGQLVDADRDRLTSFLVDAGIDPGTEPHVVDLLPPIESEEAFRQLDAADRRAVTRRLQIALGRAYSNLAALLARGVVDEEPSPARTAILGRAVELYAAGAEIAPDLPGIQRALGIASFEAGRFAQAITALERAAPGDPEVNRRLALASLEVGDAARAAELLAADPGREREPALLYAYATALVRGHRNAEAQEVFARLLASHPEWPELHVLLAKASAQSDDFESAIASLEHALRLRPDVVGAQAVLGDIYLRQGRLGAAQEALRGELERRPADVETRYRLAVALDLDRQSTAALEELERTLGARPDFADARYLAGKIHLAAGRAAEAATQLEAAARLSPDDANIHYQLSQAHQRLGNEERAGAALARYRQLKQMERAGDDG